MEWDPERQNKKESKLYKFKKACSLINKSNSTSLVSKIVEDIQQFSNFLDDDKDLDLKQIVSIWVERKNCNFWVNKMIEAIKEIDKEMEKIVAKESDKEIVEEKNIVKTIRRVSSEFFSKWLKEDRLNVIETPYNNIKFLVNVKTFQTLVSKFIDYLYENSKKLKLRETPKPNVPNASFSTPPRNRDVAECDVVCDDDDQDAEKKQIKKPKYEFINRDDDIICEYEIGKQKGNPDFISLKDFKKLWTTMDNTVDYITDIKNNSKTIRQHYIEHIKKQCADHPGNKAFTGELNNMIDKPTQKLTLDINNRIKEKYKLIKISHDGNCEYNKFLNVISKKKLVDTKMGDTLKLVCESLMNVRAESQYEVPLQPKVSWKQDTKRNKEVKGKMKVNVEKETTPKKVYKIDLAVWFDQEPVRYNTETFPLMIDKDTENKPKALTDSAPDLLIELDFNSHKNETIDSEITKDITCQKLLQTKKKKAGVLLRVNTSHNGNSILEIMQYIMFFYRRHCNKGLVAGNEFRIFYIGYYKKRIDAIAIAKETNAIQHKIYWVPHGTLVMAPSDQIVRLGCVKAFYLIGRYNLLYIPAGGKFVTVLHNDDIKSFLYDFKIVTVNKKQLVKHKRHFLLSQSPIRKFDDHAWHVKGEFWSSKGVIQETKHIIHMGIFVPLINDLKKCVPKEKTTNNEKTTKKKEFFFCIYCGTIMKNRNNLSTHKKIHFNNSLRKEENVNFKEECDVEGCKTRLKKNISIHKAIEHGIACP